MMLIPSKHALHMFQQNRYELRRYSKWLNDNVSKNTLLKCKGNLRFRKRILIGQLI